MRCVVDTNVLAASLTTQHPHHDAAIAVLDKLAPHYSMILLPQVITELWAVMTRPIASGGFGFSTEKAQENIQGLGKLFSFLPDPTSVMEIWFEMAARYKVIGRQVHDTRLAAATFAHGMKHILTFNTRDFVRFREIEAIDPAGVI